jgi:CubicO group peptidase (beta-lactamase class C family)
MNPEAIRPLFEQNFVELGELGASVSVWKENREILQLAAGFQDKEQACPWLPETRILFWSATKGLAAATTLHALQSESISLQRKVASLWPRFAKNGKQDVSLAQLLSHQAGLAALSRSVPVQDHEQVADALADEPPNWELGSRHGYHPRTFGFLLDEVVRRATGLTLASYWRQTFAEPLQLDLWIGIDPDLADSVAPIFPARNAPPKNDPFYTAFLTSGSLTSRAFASPKGLHNSGSMNSREARIAAYPGFGGIGTASSLAKFYLMLAQEGSFQGRSYFRNETLELMTRPLVSGTDAVLLMATAFSTGFMQDPLNSSGHKIRSTFGPSARAFGYPGAGGSLGFADPDSGLGFAYVMNQMAPGVLPNPKSLRLIQALYEMPPDPKG